MSVPRVRYEFASAAQVPVLRWPALDATGVVDAVVTTKHGGVSAGAYESLNLGLHVGDVPGQVIENRVRAAATVGLGLDDLVFCKQAHGRGVAHVTRSDCGRGCRADDDAIQAADALVTADRGVGLVVMVADCVPIVMVDPGARVLACVHAGWRGTTAQVTRAAIDQMAQLGADASRLVVGIGPAIHMKRYQVGEDVVVEAQAAFGTRVDELVREDGTGSWLFDLWKSNQLMLHDAGVDAANIHLAEVGTDSGDFFSDRAVRPCGRFAAIAKLC